MANEMERVMPIKLERNQIYPLRLILMIAIGFGIGIGLMFLSWHWFPALKQVDPDGFVSLLYAIAMVALGFIGGLSTIKKVTIMLDSEQIHFNAMPVIKISPFGGHSVLAYWSEVRAWQLTQYNGIIPNISLDLGNKGRIELWSTQQTIDTKQYKDMDGQAPTLQAIGQWLPGDRMNPEAFTVQNNIRYLGGYFMLGLSIFFPTFVLWALINHNFSIMDTLYLALVSVVVTVGLLLSGILLLRRPAGR